MGDLPPPNELRRCPRCLRFRLTEDFARNRSAKNGLSGYCKPCHNEVVRENRVRNHGSTRGFMLKHRYGITELRVQALLERQGGGCGICGGPAEHVDHDHKTGKVRGILCFNCNGALGRFADSVPRLRRAMKYLQAHGETHRPESQ